MIRLDRLTKIFQTADGAVTAVDQVSLELGEGEICVLLGPSGCGKTTTMKMINRLVAPTSGKIFINDKDTDDYDPVQLRRTIGYVIQQIGLFPNKTVADNIATVPHLLGWDRKKARARSAELLETLALDPAVFMDRYPKELSGGQQQRIGVARALAADPPVMLMDEPFGAIDPINRQVIQDEFLKMQQSLRKTIMFVSHDLDEAVKMADRIAIFREGRLEQFDSPDAILSRPATPFVEEFLGTDRVLKRLRLIKIADAMRRDPPRVTAQDTLQTAIQRMEENGHSAIVMVGPRGRPRGLVTLDDARRQRGSVGEHHTPVPKTIVENDDLRAAVSTMFAGDIPLLPCVDADGIYVGLLSQSAISNILAQDSLDR
ncbi:ABC transporter ATP-binding protein [Algihabitans sp.]|uniref:ABC transporter ATP-binding protein n=1 Tax=Algihabitans sp. TaxID=2821514 RepID=UPI003BAABCE8